MSHFKGCQFSYGGKNGKEFELQLVRLGNDTSTSMFGVERSIEEEVTSNFVPTFKGVKYTSPSIDITLAKVRNGEPVPFSDNDLFLINQWLFGRNEYLPFASEDNKDVLYYGIFTKGAKYENGLRHGYLNLTLRLNSACCYSAIRHNTFTVSDSKTVEIMNRSNVDEFLYPDVSFKLLGENQSISITNLTLGETMSFEGLAQNSEIYCYNDGLKHIENKTNPTQNVRPMFNKKWIKLSYGKNLIKINGKCKIDIIYQEKIALQ